MAVVGDVLAKKGNRVYAIVPSASVLEATRLMNRHKIGALVVTIGARDEERECDRVAGIITERDVLTRLVVGQRDPAAVGVPQMRQGFIGCRVRVVCLRHRRPDGLRGVGRR